MELHRSNKYRSKKWRGLTLPLELLKEMSKRGEKNIFQEFSMGARDIAPR